MKSVKIRYLDGVRLRNSIIESSKLLNRMKESLNQINVFPIPDHDTGTNMAHTMNQISVGLSTSSERSIAVMSSELVEAALMKAQGCSGVILAQFFQGFAEAVKDKIQLSTMAFAAAVQNAKEKAYLALSNPTEGTILTVISDWANHINVVAKKIDDFTDILKSGLQIAKHSLAETPKKLEVLKKAGVVDAGAQGFVHILEGIESFINNGKIQSLKFVGKLSSIKIDNSEKTDQEIATKTNSQKIGIVTDSSCDLPAQFIKENSIHYIPLKLIFGNKTYLDKVEITPSEFYNKLVTSPVYPKTSQPAVADIKKVYEKILPLYEKIISIHISGAVSGTLRNVEMTAKMISKNIITCIDGKNISGALGLIIMDVVDLINAKKLSFEQIIDQIKILVDNTHIVISLPTVKYLVKGGRLSKPKGLISKILRLNPIVSINKKGEMFSASKAFGNKAAMKKSLKMVVEIAQNYKRVKFGVAHANALSKALWYSDQLKEAFHITEEIPIVEAAPVLGVHAGPGTAGIAFIGYND